MEVTDPVCGMRMDSKEAHADEMRSGRNYYFCSIRCHRLFKADPGKFAAKMIQGGGHASDGEHTHHR